MYILESQKNVNTLEIFAFFREIILQKNYLVRTKVLSSLTEHLQKATDSSKN